MITLIIHEKYKGINIPIDPSTFNFEGHIEGYDDSRKDCWISFVPVSELDVEQIAIDLKNILKLNVNKDEYVKLKIKFEDYETDKRPRISVRLPSGYRGIMNPASFSLK